MALLACMLVSPISSTASHPAAKRYYLSRRPVLKVTLTVYRHHVYRASVSAEGVCSNGEQANGLGYGIVGGHGLPIRGRAYRFGKTIVGTTNRMVFRGRVEGNRVVGVFSRMYREESPQPGGKEEVPGPQCGTGSSPRGRYLHFVARRVGGRSRP